MYFNIYIFIYLQNLLSFINIKEITNYLDNNKKSQITIDRPEERFDKL